MQEQSVDIGLQYVRMIYVRQMQLSNTGEPFMPATKTYKESSIVYTYEPGIMGLSITLKIGAWIEDAKDDTPIGWANSIGDMEVTKLELEGLPIQVTHKYSEQLCGKFVELLDTDSALAEDLGGTLMGAADISEDEEDEDEDEDEEDDYEDDEESDDEFFDEEEEDGEDD